MSNPSTPAVEPRTAQDGYNRLLAIAFEERVNAQAYSQQVEQKLAMAGQIIESLRADLKDREEKNAALAQQVADLMKPAANPVQQAVAELASADSAGGTAD